MTLGVRLLVFGHWADLPPPSLLIELGHKNSEVHLSSDVFFLTKLYMVQIESVDEVVITFAFMVAQGKTQTLHHLTFNTFISTCSSSISLLSVGTQCAILDMFSPSVLAYWQWTHLIWWSGARSPLSLSADQQKVRHIAFVTSIGIILDVTNIVERHRHHNLHHVFCCYKGYSGLGGVEVLGRLEQDLVIRAMFTSTPCSLSPPHAPSPSRHRPLLWQNRTPPEYLLDPA